MINCESHLELNWTKNCLISDAAGNTEFKIKNTKLYVSIVTLSTKDNVKLTKQLNVWFKRPVYWNEYKTKIASRSLRNQNPTIFYLDASFQRITTSFVHLLLLMLLIIQLTILMI